MTSKQPGRLSQIFRDIPYATLAIIAINVVIAVFTSEQMSYVVRRHGLVPASVKLPNMISANFIHDGYLHLGINMILLYIFGRGVERVMGRIEFVIFYIGACLAASVLHVAIVLASLPEFYEKRALIGASGPVAGVMGIYAVRFHRKVFRLGGTRLPALLFIGGWLMLQLALGILGLYRDSFLGLGLKQVGYWSHLGGFAFGIVVALAANMALQGEREHLIAQAERHYSDGNLLEATQSLESLLRYDPDNAFAHAELARLWAILEEEDQSVPSYQVAIALYISQGQEERALERAEEMKQFWPSSSLSAPMRFRLATYIEEAGQPERAIRAFREIVEESPDSAEAQMALLKIGQLQLSVLHDSASAAGTLRDFLDRYPESEWRKFAQETLVRASARPQC